MSFSISDEKLEKLMLSSDSCYAVASAEPSVATENFAPFYAVSGTAYSAPVLVGSETKRRFADLRQKIVESGVPLSSAEDLDAEIRTSRRISL